MQTSLYCFSQTKISLLFFVTPWAIQIKIQKAKIQPVKLLYIYEISIPVQGSYLPNPFKFLVLDFGGFLTP